MLEPNSSGPALEIASWRRSKAEAEGLLRAVSKRASVMCGEKLRCSFAMPSGSSDVSMAAASAPNSAPASIPAQRTRGRRSFGKNPTPRNFNVINFGRWICDSDALIGSIFSGGTSPINFSVTCMPSMRTHRAGFGLRLESARIGFGLRLEPARTGFGLRLEPARILSEAGRSFSMSAPIAARTSSGISSATKTRTRSAFRARLAANSGRELLGLRRVKKIAPDEVECRLRSLPTDAVTLSWIAYDTFFAAGSVGDGDVHRAYRFFRRAACWTRDTSDPDAERRACAAANAVGERDRHFRADRATRFDNFGGHIHPRGFERVAIGNDAAQKIS